MKLKHKGRAVKIVKDKNDDCQNCIFQKRCNKGIGAPAEKFEKENSLEDCIDTGVKYIYA